MGLNSPAPAPPARTVPMALFAVVVLVVAGAAIGATAAYFELKPTPAPPGSIPVTDDVGRTVDVPPNPARVVVLAPSILDSMVRLGLRDRVVGVDCGTPASGGLSTDYNASQISEWNLSTNLCIETSPSVNIAQVLNASPQLVLVSTIISISDVEEMSVTYHIPVLVLQPSTIGGIAVDVTLLGQIFDATGAASALVNEMQTILGNDQNLVTNLSYAGTPFPTVLLTYYASPAASPEPGYWTYGPGTFGESLIEFVGAASISGNSTLPYPLLSGPQVLAANPSVVIYGTGFGVTLTTYQQGPLWSSLPAVTNGTVYGIDSNFITEPDPTMVLEGVPTLLALLHPPAGQPA
jgi:ABC-type Fe3+-hydroxamate transport system substrate-binding protein